MNVLTLTMSGSQRAPVRLEYGETGLGSAEDNQFVLVGAGILPRHVRITVNEDGAMIRPAEVGAQVRLNERLVESMAFLHEGDRIDLGDKTLLVSLASANPPAPASAADDDRATQVRRVPPKFLLRGLTGPQLGKLIPIYGRLVIGRSGECDLIVDAPGLSARHAVFETLPEGLILRDLDSASGSQVNGKRVRDPSALRHGDQVQFDQVRFLVQSIDQLDTPSTTPGPTGDGKRGLRNAVMFLVGAALVAAAVAAALLSR